MSSHERPKTAAGSRPGSSKNTSAPPSRVVSGPVHHTELRSRSTVASAARSRTAISRDAVSNINLSGNSHSAEVQRPLTGSAQKRSSGMSRPLSEDEHWRSRANVSNVVSGEDIGQRLTTPGPGFDTPMPGGQILTSRGSGSARPLTGAMERIRVVDRPITQQGLVGQRSLPTGGTRARVIQDRSYYLALLRTKISELQTETNKLQKQSDVLEQEQTTAATYETRVKQTAAELLELQEELGDYNMMVELINMGSNQSSIDREYEEYKNSNDSETLVVEKLFSNRKQLETELASLEAQLEQDRNMIDTMANSMSAGMRERYYSKQQEYAQLQISVEQMQQQIQARTDEKAQLERDISVSREKQEAAELYRRLTELETSKEQLLNTQKSFETPEQEKERLLTQVKKDRSQLSTMDKTKKELSREIEKYSEEMERIEIDLESTSSESYNKLTELKKREEVMDNFLNSFESKYNELKTILNEKENSKINTSERNKLVQYSKPQFSAEDLMELKNDLENKTSLENHKQLSANLNKITALESKLQEEKQLMEKQIVKMKEDMKIFTDLATLKSNHNNNHRILKESKVKITEKLDLAKETVANIEVQFDKISKELDSNDAYVQLGILERRLATIEMNNFSLNEQITNQQSENDYQSLAERVMATVSEENDRLKALAASGKNDD